MCTGSMRHCYDEATAVGFDGECEWAQRAGQFVSLKPLVELVEIYKMGCIHPAPFLKIGIQVLHVGLSAFNDG